MASVRVGTSGWDYPRWRGGFYPAGLPRLEELAHLARQLDTVEVNASFYRLQSATSYRAWCQAVPPDFLFAVKGSRFITHLKRLQDVDQALANYFGSGLLALGNQLGPVLWQLPARATFDASTLKGFLSRLPRTTSQAARLASRHDQRVRDPYVEVEAERPLRHVLEPRHPSFAGPDALELLRAHDCGLVVADSAGSFPMFDEVTSDVVYVRLHGTDRLYGGRYSDDGLARWAARVDAWCSTGCDVYVYFDNDADGHAPHDAVRLRRLVAGT